MVRESTGNYCHKLFQDIIRHLSWSDILADFSLLSALLIRKLIIILANYQNACFLFLPHPLCFRDQPPYLRYKHPDNIGWYNSWLCSKKVQETWKTSKIVWKVCKFAPKYLIANPFKLWLKTLLHLPECFVCGSHCQYPRPLWCGHPSIFSWSVTVWRVCIHDQISEQMSNLLSIFLFPFNTRLFFFVSSILQKYMFGCVLSQICLKKRQLKVNCLITSSTAWPLSSCPFSWPSSSLISVSSRQCAP